MSDSSRHRGRRVPSLVLFDLDDTLCDHDSSLRLRLRLAFGAAAEGRDDLDLDLEALIEQAVARSVGGTAHFAELLRAHGIAEPERCQRAIDHYVSDRYRGLQLFDDAVETVSVISQRAHVGMITNGPSRIQRDKITRLAIESLFEFILVSEEEGVWKPDPAIFRRALELCGIDAGDAVFVGDSPEHDIAGARAAGIRSIWINRRGRNWPGGPEPDHVITRLSELTELLGIAPTEAKLKST
jgi:putative hydrolase of the HAD superfamily